MGSLYIAYILLFIHILPSWYVYNLHTYSYLTYQPYVYVYFVVYTTKKNFFDLLYAATSNTAWCYSKNKIINKSYETRPISLLCYCVYHSNGAVLPNLFWLLPPLSILYSRNVLLQLVHQTILFLRSFPNQSSELFSSAKEKLMQCIFFFLRCRPDTPSSFVLHKTHIVKINSGIIDLHSFFK